MRVIGGDEVVDLAACTAGELAGARVYRTPDGRWLAPAFRDTAVDLGPGPLPGPDDEDGISGLILRWVEAVRGEDWRPLRGSELDGEEDWIDLRTAMARVGWGPGPAQRIWEAARTRPYAPALPTAAGWAGGGWVVPAAPGEAEPAFARPVLEARSLMRWAYIGRWEALPVVPGTALPEEVEPHDPEWADLLSRFRQDHHTGASLDGATELAVEILGRTGLGPRNPLEAEDDPLPDRDVAAALTDPSAVVRAAAWFLLRDEAEAWEACLYSECQHHWAVEAEEDAYELEEVLEIAGHGIANPVDAAYQRRRLLTLAFGDVNDVPLAGAGDLEDFLAFYQEWVAHGRPEEDFEQAARDLAGD